IDTPGYGAFISDARSCLRVADGAVLLVDGVAVVEVQTEEAWGFAQEFDLPVLIAASRLDRENASLSRALDSIGASCGRQVARVQVPVGAEKGFRGVVDLIPMKACVSRGDGSGGSQPTATPPPLADEAKAARDKLMEMVAEVDDALMEKFFSA